MIKHGLLVGHNNGVKNATDSVNMTRQNMATGLSGFFMFTTCVYMIYVQFEQNPVAKHRKLAREPHQIMVLSVLQKCHRKLLKP